MAVAKKDDVTSLWNQAYPEASTAPTNTLAKSQADVDAMSIRDRLWDSSNFTYGQQRLESDRSFDQAMSQLDNQLIGRGMQRSSYGAATSANLANKKIEAQKQIYGAQIADYENRLMQVEQQEEATRQFNAQMANNWLQQIIAKGGTPSAELLAQAGLSQADYNAMVQQIDAGGGGGYSAPAKSSGSGKKTDTTTKPTASDAALQYLLNPTTNGSLKNVTIAAPKNNAASKPVSSTVTNAAQNILKSSSSSATPAKSSATTAAKSVSSALTSILKKDSRK